MKYKPDFIFLNPDDGYEDSLRHYYQLKKESAVRDVPIILILKEDELKAAEIPSGIEDILVRPVRGEECLTRARILYKKLHNVTSKNQVRAGDLEIDLSRYEVRVNGLKVDLTYTEYELLKFLSLHRGNVFSRDVLLNKVWGYEYYGGQRTVDVHIRRLRSKIEIKKGQRFIETVRNIGYRFVAGDEE